MALRASLAGLLAFVLALVVELAVLGLLGAELEWLLAIGVAPPVEEVAKRLAMLWLGAGWAMTGLAFGVIEAGLKLGEWQGVGVAGAISSLLQHWAYGRFAEQRGIGLAIGLHMGFNLLVVLGDLAMGAAGFWLAPVGAALMLCISFRQKHLDRGVDLGRGPP